MAPTAAGFRVCLRATEAFLDSTILRDTQLAGGLRLRTALRPGLEACLMPSQAPIKTAAATLE